MSNSSINSTKMIGILVVSWLSKVSFRTCTWKSSLYCKISSSLAWQFLLGLRARSNFGFELSCCGCIFLFYMDFVVFWSIRVLQTSSGASMFHKRLLEHPCFTNVFWSIRVSQTSSGASVFHKRLREHPCFTNVFWSIRVSQTSSGASVFHKRLREHPCFTNVFWSIRVLQTSSGASVFHKCIYIYKTVISSY